MMLAWRRYAAGALPASFDVAGNPYTPRQLLERPRFAVERG
jgi:hypothetical protein